jgi:ABC-type histidine transport system ATPase subunit
MAEQALVVEDLHKRFGDLEVLKGVSVEAEMGDVIAMIGSSGSGKSTLLRCINLLETPDSGQVFVSGELIRMRPTKDGHAVPEDWKQVDRIRSTLGMVFQSFNLWSHMTILENVIEAPVHVLKVPKKEAIERAEKLLQKVGIADKRNHYPSHLSGGQQQRAAIARALAGTPRLLLADEPTGNLDSQMARGVMELLEEINAAGTTIVMVTHDPELAARAQRNVHIVDGMATDISVESSLLRARNLASTLESN